MKGSRCHLSYLPKRFVTFFISHFVWCPHEGLRLKPEETIFFKITTLNLKNLSSWFLESKQIEDKKEYR